MALDNEYINQINKLKSALLSLKPTGVNGFEGLMGVMLSVICGAPFRLAASGSQFGVDGQTIFEGDAICFEAKRYDDTIPREKVITKIADLSKNDNQTEIWVLGATSQLTSQLADDIRYHGRKNGIAITILDWSQMDMPPLATALAMGGKRIEVFLKTNLSNNNTFQDAATALSLIRNHPDYQFYSNKIREQCNQISMGLALAKRGNTKWLNDVFTSRKSSRREFGQPLSPGDPDGVGILERKELKGKIETYFNSIPHERTVFVLGGEGHGKSWLIAQSWLDLDSRPLTVLMSPDDFSNKFEHQRFIDVVILKLIKQTGDAENQTSIERWRRRFKLWESIPAETRPRIVVVVDGINQRPNLGWAQIIEGFNHMMEQFGGCLIVTSRTQYFRNQLKGRLIIPYNEIDVPEWTKHELDTILNPLTMKSSELHIDVVESLKNPRILSIALTLFKNTDIVHFEELSVSRLLFEYMGARERDYLNSESVHDFARKLQGHAQEVLERKNSGQEDDLAVFEVDIEATSEGKFFQPLDDDPTKYKLEDDGLVVALGFAVLDQLKKARRNNHNLDERLNAIVEPIAALDITAEVIIAALTVAILDDRCHDDLAICLIKSFASLQNPNQGQYRAFAGLARVKPLGFMEAAKYLSLSGYNQPNFDWIGEALIYASVYKQAWQKMACVVNSWLSLYSKSPELGVITHPRHDSNEEKQSKVEKSQNRIDEKLHNLSGIEQDLLNDLNEVDGDYSKLSLLAFFLLAGKPLAPFTQCLSNWSFASSFNSSPYHPNKEFRHLVWFNNIDWASTRDGLLEACSKLRSSEVSEVGKWALLYILRATGHPNDAKQANSLHEILTKDYPPLESWRRIEDYCSTDPCDPASDKPENIVQTAKEYAEINVEQLWQSRFWTSESHFLNGACTGLARFEHHAAVAKHKEFAANVLKRVGVPLIYGLWELRDHNSLLTLGEAHSLIGIRDQVASFVGKDGFGENEVWNTSQNLLILAFPFLTSLDQFNILVANDVDESISLDLSDLFKPLPAIEFDNLLDNACNEHHELKQYLLLAFGRDDSLPISATTISNIATLLHSKSQRVLDEAFIFVAQCRDDDLLRLIIDSSWKAKDSDTENDLQDWYGSVALLEGAASGLLDHHEALERISERLCGPAALILEKDSVQHIACIIGGAINRVLDLDGDLVLPEIDISTSPIKNYQPPIFSLRENIPEDLSVAERMKRFSESRNDQKKRRKFISESFFEFKEKIIHANAKAIFDNMTLEEFVAVVDSAPEFANRWYNLFKEVSHEKLPAIHNHILLLAHALGDKETNKSKNLFLLLRGNKPLVNFTYGRSGVLLDAIALWAGARNSELDSMRFERLDRAASDHDLSLEVLAAYLSNQHELLVEYIEEKLGHDEPLEICRGIMVAGLSEHSKLNNEVLQKYETSAGLIADAQKAAKYAYDRNIWARHWYQLMCQTNNNIDFWRYSILFTKIVDGRFDIWQSEYEKKGESIKLFELSLDDKIKHRISRWEYHRKNKLFGSDAPHKIFLQK